MVWFLQHFLDPSALLIVFGGTVVSVLLSSSRRDCGLAIAALRAWWAVSPAADAEQAARAVRQIKLILKERGRIAAERVRTPLDFVHRAAVRLSECRTIDEFAEAEFDEIAERAATHAAAIAVWRTAAETAPSMGMIGTVIGLIVMFTQANAPDDMVPALAVAMLTTLYGLILSAVIAGPVASRLEHIAAAERDWQERSINRLIDVARRDEDSAASPSKPQPWRPDRQRYAA